MIRAVALLLLLAIGVAGFVYKPSPAEEAVQHPSQEDKRPYVETSRATRQTIYRHLNVPGEALPNQQVTVFARVQGYLEEISVDHGSFVEAGKPLFKIAVPELQKQLEKEEAEEKVCAPSEARDEATVAWRKAIYDRLLEVRQKSPDLLNAESLDDAKGRYEVAEAELKLTQAKKLGLEAAAAKTREMIKFATYKAPFDGFVTERWVDPGELIQPGVTKILHLIQVNPIRVRIAVPAPDVPFVRSDSKASVTFDELPGKEFKVEAVRLFWALKSSTKTMSVELDIANGEKLVRTGMYPRVSIELDEHKNALVLPASALVSEKKKTFVYVVKDGVASKKPIKLGYDDGIHFEVLEGIGDQDEAIVTGKNLVSDGEKVRAKPQ